MQPTLAGTWLNDMAASSGHEKMAHVTEGRPRHKTVLALIVVATLIGVISIFAVWAKRQILETDSWVETSSELVEDHDIQEAVAGFLVDALYNNVDVEAELSKRLPPQVQSLAGPVAGALRELADRAALEALQTPRVQQLWEDANRAAHETFVQVVEDDTDEDVTLDLNTILEDLGDRVGIDVADRLPPDAGQIQVLGTDQLSAVQDGVRTFRTVGYVLAFGTLLLYAVAIYLAAGWRRQALRATGFGFIVIGIAGLAIRGFSGDLIVESLAKTAASEPAVNSTWTIGTEMLAGVAWAMIGYGIVLILGAWLAGPGTWAQSVRRTITPVLRERVIGYAVLLVIVLLVFWWAPTQGTQRLLPSLVLIGLMVAGFEALRAQALRDFPDETFETLQQRWRSRRAG
jgi:hypothetical protein